MKKEILMLSIQVLSLLIVLTLIVVVGIFVVNKVGYQIGFLNGYCFDKEGMVDVSKLPLNIFESKFINCSLCNEGRCFDVSISKVT